MSHQVSRIIVKFLDGNIRFLCNEWFIVDLLHLREALLRQDYLLERVQTSTGMLLFLFLFLIYQLVLVFLIVQAHLVFLLHKLILVLSHKGAGLREVRSSHPLPLLARTLLDDEIGK